MRIAKLKNKRVVVDYTNPMGKPNTLQGMLTHVGPEKVALLIAAQRNGSKPNRLEIYITKTSIMRISDMKGNNYLTSKV